METNVYKINLNKEETFIFENDTNVICIGFFNGIHPVHEKILSKTKELATQINASMSVFTFEEKIGKKSFNIFPNEIKYKKIKEKHMPDFIFELQINTNTIGTNKDIFLDYLSNNLKVKKIVVGSDIKFGHKAQGTVELLIEKFGADNVYIFKRDDSLSTSNAQSHLLNYEFDKFRALMNYDFRLYVHSIEDGVYQIYENSFEIKNGIYLCDINGTEIEIEINNNVIKSNLIFDNFKVIKLMKEL